MRNPRSGGASALQHKPLLLVQAVDTSEQGKIIHTLMVKLPLMVQCCGPLFRPRRPQLFWYSTQKHHDEGR
jgi:hypothetical protein